MDFTKYIEKLKNKYTVEEGQNNVYRVSKGGRELIISPNRMFEESFLEDFFNKNYQSEDWSMRMNKYFLDDKIQGDFGRIGEDDLLPSFRDLFVGRGRPKGSIPEQNVDDFNRREEHSDSSFIKKDPISPLHGKKGPDPDNFKKPGNDDDPNKFFY
ncbi:hypothetical protein NGRA_1207 [Nosema granulosis]|uniref:Uncharacterized protein n=1 Tax=Nosema granulosis TaxID=83296 RepID=A0A9P6GZE7_9MICR|nr:hypothetical protein NGRA_1207 [Nosema granulosis]